MNVLAEQYDQRRKDAINQVYFIFGFISKFEVYLFCPIRLENSNNENHI